MKEKKNKNFCNYCNKTYRQENYYNNLAISVIPDFIASKSSVGEIISKTVQPHFLRTSLPRIPINIFGKLFFHTCLNYIPLG